MYNNSYCHILSWILDPKKSLFEKRLIHSNWKGSIHTKLKRERKRNRSNDIQKRSKNKRQTSEIDLIFAFVSASALAQCEWTLRPHFSPLSFVIYNPNLKFFALSFKPQSWKFHRISIEPLWIKQEVSDHLLPLALLTWTLMTTENQHFRSWLIHCTEGTHISHSATLYICHETHIRLHHGSNYIAENL